MMEIIQTKKSQEIAYNNRLKVEELLNPIHKSFSDKYEFLYALSRNGVAFLTTDDIKFMDFYIKYVILNINI